MSYIPRIYFDRSDVDILADAFRYHQNVLLLGPTGTGKTSLVEEAAEKFGRPFRYVPCHSGASSETLIGQYVPASDGRGYVWMDGVLTAAVRHGYVVLLDEINSLMPEVAFVVHGLLDHRRELVLTEKAGPDGGPEVIQAHQHFAVVGAGNPDYEGVRIMNEAFRDRFPIQLHMGYFKELDVSVLREGDEYQDLDGDQQQAVEELVTRIRDASAEGRVHSDFSTRAFKDFLGNFRVHGYNIARICFLTRYNTDEGEQGFLRTTFNEIWDREGKPRFSQGGRASQPRRRGRAGAFGAEANSDTEQAAAGTF